MVNPSDFLYFIPQLPKHLHISCQRCGIAGDIHDAVRLHAGHGVEEVFFAAFSRRIDNDDVRVGVFARMVFGVLFVVGRKNLFRFFITPFATLPDSCPITAFRFCWSTTDPRMERSK